MKYGDAVVFVQKNVDGSLRRVHAIVLASSLHGAITANRRPAEEGKDEEHLDLAFPVLSLVPDGQVLKTRNLEEIFRPAYDVRPWVEDAWVGWEAADEPADGFVVPASELLELSRRIQKYAPDLEMCPDAVVASAITMIDRVDKQPPDNYDAFNAAIQWREYASALEDALITEGHPNLARVASEATRTVPPTGEEVALLQHESEPAAAEIQPGVVEQPQE